MAVRSWPTQLALAEPHWLCWSGGVLSSGLALPITAGWRGQMLLRVRTSRTDAGGLSEVLGCGHLDLRHREWRLHGTVSGVLVLRATWSGLADPVRRMILLKLAREVFPDELLCAVPMCPAPASTRGVCSFHAVHAATIWPDGRRPSSRVCGCGRLGRSQGLDPANPFPRAGAVCFRCRERIGYFTAKCGPVLRQVPDSRLVAELSALLAPFPDARVARS